MRVREEKRKKERENVSRKERTPADSEAANDPPIPPPKLNILLFNLFSSVLHLY